MFDEEYFYVPDPPAEEIRAKIESDRNGNFWLVTDTRYGTNRHHIEFPYKMSTQELKEVFPHANPAE